MSDAEARLFVRSDVSPRQVAIWLAGALDALLDGEQVHDSTLAAVVRANPDHEPGSPDLRRYPLLVDARRLCDVPAFTERLATGVVALAEWGCAVVAQWAHADGLPGEGRFGFDDQWAAVAARLPAGSRAPATPDEVNRAEARLGVTFPRTLRRYLTTFGWLEHDQREWFGLGAGVPTWLRMDDMTLAERESEVGLAPDLVAIQNDGMGDLVCVRCSASRFGEVVWVRHDEDPPQLLEVECTDLQAWFAAAVSEPVTRR